MAENIYIEVEADGAVIPGASTVLSLARADKIECTHVSGSVSTERHATRGMAGGRRTHQPLCFTKQIDKATPLLYEAMVSNKVINLVARWYRPATGGDGTTEQFFTISIEGGRISRISHHTDATDAAEPPQECVEIAFPKITWEHMDGKIASDDWKENT